jgi:hypothetical protein
MVVGLAILGVLEYWAWITPHLERAIGPPDGLGVFLGDALAVIRWLLS